ncbi:hypothetical protein C8F04DRAFT_899805, partial [Mycena alexandri]
MADVARSYHSKLQQDRREVAEDIRKETIRKVLSRTARKMTEEQAATLKAPLTVEDVRKALRLSANFKAPGINGITYELWKTLEGRYQTAISQEKPAFDVLKAMCAVFNDIEKHGMVKNSGFSE